METVRRKQRPQRREQILEAAVALFHERGYEATGIDEIGEAAEISGPAVYRHFRNKEEILETLLRDRGAATLAEVQAMVEGSRSPQAALDALIDHHAGWMASNPSLAVVALYERRTLSPQTRAIIDRLERLNVEEWVHLVSQVRAELSDTEARIAVHAVLGMGAAVCNYPSGLSAERTAALIASMMRAGLRR